MLILYHTAKHLLGTTTHVVRQPNNIQIDRIISLTNFNAQFFIH